MKSAALKIPGKRPLDRRLAADIGSETGVYSSRSTDTSPTSLCAWTTDPDNPVALVGLYRF